MAKNLTKGELVEVVRRICEAEYKNEQERHKLLVLFLDNVPDPEATRLISHHKPELTPEEIVEKALAYKPILL